MIDTEAHHLLATFDRTHRAAALRTCRRLVGDTEAEDLVQETLERAVCHAEDLSDPDALRAWFHRVMANLAANRRRWLRVRLRGAEHLRAMEPSHTSPAASDPILRNRIAAALGRLSTAQQQVISLVYVDGRTVDEAAAEMGCAGGTARSHLHRALSSLRASLAPLRE